MEYLFSDVPDEIFWVGSVDCCSFVDHSFDVDWQFTECAVSHVRVENEHDFLSSADCWDRYQHLPVLLHGLIDYADQSAFDAFSVGHDVVRAPVGAFND